METTRDKLRKAGERRTAANAEFTAAANEVNALIRQAVAEGIPKAEVARLAGISRNGLYKLLG